MRPRLPEKLWLVQWHWLFAGLAVVGLLFWLLGSIAAVFKGCLFSLLYFTSSAAVFGMLVLAAEAVRILKIQQEQTEDIKEYLTTHKELLEEISQGVRLSDTAKTICYRDRDRQQLRATVLERLHQQDYQTTDAMLEEIAARAEYKNLAEELKLASEQYRNSTEYEQIRQVVNYIDRLLEQHLWTDAAAQVERLIKKYPDSQEAQAAAARLTEKKELRKRELLDRWDSAVKKSDIDGSLAVLKELDLYLTPSEGLALQEAASEMFKNKLHNIGVRFSLAVSEKQWTAALEAGKEIMRDFPNSRMADEIRGKWAILQELSTKTGQGGK